MGKVGKVEHKLLPHRPVFPYLPHLPHLPYLPLLATPDSRFPWVIPGQAKPHLDAR